MYINEFYLFIISMPKRWRLYGGDLGVALQIQPHGGENVSQRCLNFKDCNVFF